MTEGLSAEVFVKAERSIAGNPSVLTADRIYVIQMLPLSQRMTVFFKRKPCRKPASFTQGSQEFVLSEACCFYQIVNTDKTIQQYKNIYPTPLKTKNDLQVLSCRSHFYSLLILLCSWVLSLAISLSFILFSLAIVSL